LAKQFGSTQFDIHLYKVNKVCEIQAQQGKFQAVEGDMDQRVDQLKDINLSPGFTT
jgi:hypothetical protein